MRTVEKQLRALPVLLQNYLFFHGLLAAVSMASFDWRHLPIYRMNHFFSLLTPLISPLAGLTQLTLLVLDFNPISDLSPLTGLTQLEALTLAGSRSDLSPLAGLTRLEMLYFFDNKISDLSPLAGLTELELLRLGDNVISDLSPLVDSCLGAGDFVDLRENLLDVDDCADLQTLASRVDLQHDVSCSDMPPSSKETRDHESSKAGRSIYEEYRDWIANKGDYKERTRWLFPRLKE